MEVVKADFAPGPLTNHKSHGLCCDWAWAPAAWAW